MARDGLFIPFNEIPHTKLDWIHPQLASYEIDMRFSGIPTLRFTRRACLPTGDVVRVHTQHLQPCVGDAVTTGSVQGATKRGVRADTTIGAAVEDGLAL